MSRSVLLQPFEETELATMRCVLILLVFLLLTSVLISINLLRPGDIIRWPAARLA